MDVSEDTAIQDQIPAVNAPSATSPNDRPAQPNHASPLPSASNDNSPAPSTRSSNRNIAPTHVPPMIHSNGESVTSPSATTRTNGVEDVEMLDVGHPVPNSAASPTTKTYSAAGENSRESSPYTTASLAEDGHPSTGSKKRKLSEEPRIASLRAQSQPQSPSNASSNPKSRLIRKGRSPASSIFPPNSPADQLSENPQGVMTSKTASPAPISELAMTADTDSIRRDAAAGYESRLRARQPGNAKKDGGQRMGISASGRDVKIGSSARQAAQPKKDKGKSKVDAVQANNPNQDFCSACRGIGRFLCCDGCPRSFHFMCLEPPLRLDELPPEEMWLCKECRTDKSREDEGTPAREKDLPALPTVFKTMCKRIDEENPEQFKLPTDVRKFFSGISTGSEGEYVDAKDTRTKIDRKGFLEDRDPFRIRDGRQKKIECYRCGGTALPKHVTITDPAATWRQIVSCDYCPLSFHLDCLSPPPSIMPSAGRKWMCPNHPDHVMPQRRTLAENLTVIDVSNKGQRNNGNIEISKELDGSESSEMDYDDIIINRKKYRVPEKIIKLDFWSKLAKQKDVQPDRLDTSVNGMDVDEREAGDFESTLPEMDDLNAAAMMMALAFSRHTPIIAPLAEKPDGLDSTL